MPAPGAAPGEAIIRVQAAAVCASDIHIYRDEFPCTLPVVLGHEFTGVVTEVGTGVDHVAPGDSVVAANNRDACGTCPACRDGYPNVCPAKRAIGIADRVEAHDHPIGDRHHQLPGLRAVDVGRARALLEAGVVTPG